MPEQPERQPRDDRQLVLLQRHITVARADVQLGRSLPPGSQRALEQGRRCERLTQALQAYADAASDAGVPLPYRYRDELRLYRSMYPGTARSRSQAASS